MGYRELIDSLQREAEEKTRGIRRDAEARAEKLKAEAGERIELLKDEYAQMQASALREQTEAILREAEVRAMAVRLCAENELLERLFAAALSSLASLRDERYVDVFRALHAELPPFEWQEVRVNPEDLELAGKLFPGSEVIPEPGISGGMEAASGDGRIRAVNTFEKRLEKAWPGMVPDVMRDVHGEIEGHTSA
jgi:V/A-type H+-transporting ATPase subunit E